MKSRLLPPTSDERENEVADSTATLNRRESDIVNTFDEVASAIADESAESQVSKSAPIVSRPTPQVSARPQGRYVVVAILLATIGSLSYSLWATFLRDAAYGVVTGEVTQISPPWAGTISALHVRAGDTVRQSDVLAIVEDFNLQADIDRHCDELRSAQAELDAQAALLALAARERGNEAEAIRATYFETRGDLLSEQSRYAGLASKLERRQELAHTQAYSDEEIESLAFLKQGLADKIENLQQSVLALEARLQTLPTHDHNLAQLKPRLAKIEYLQAEIARLRDKQRRGTLRAPQGGTIVEVRGHIGERVDAQQPFLEILPTESLKLIIYVEQADINAYQVGNQLEVIVDPAPKPLACRITRIGQRLETPQSQVVGRYRPEQKLVPVHLTPNRLPAKNELRLGSTIRLPATFFSTTPN